MSPGDWLRLRRQRSVARIPWICTLRATASCAHPPPPFPSLQAAFDAAIRRFEYPGQYRGVFPVKCNHDREVIRSIVEYGELGGCGSLFNLLHSL